MTDQLTADIDPAGPDSGNVAVWLGFAAMCLGMFMAILDIQIVATSLPEIQAALGIARADMSWIQTAYLSAEVVAIPLTGFLIRRFGLRLTFCVAVTAFALASAGCATSSGMVSLLVWRTVQGFAGGTLIPTVFAAVFILFGVRQQALATTLAGVLAVLAPTLGPVAGGWITSTFSWHWLFLVNVVPGILAAVCGAATLTGKGRSAVRRFDIIGLLTLAVALVVLQVALKEAPDRGWSSGLILGLLALSASAAAGFIARSTRAEQPLVTLGTFRDRNFAIGCLLSFILGIGLFGSVYLMPVFLGFVRDHTALAIGTIMIVTGAAQLVSAPVVVWLERRLDARWMSGVGFTALAVGLGLSAFQIPTTDFDDMFWPQVIRGLAFMFCLLPPTRLALGQLSPDQVADGSGVFNLMRNLGGAIGIALIDTVIYGRVDGHAATLMTQLKAGDTATASFVGVPQAALAQAATAADSAAVLLQPLVEKAALTMAINDAWGLVAVLTALALPFIPFARQERGATEVLH